MTPTLDVHRRRLTAAGTFVLSLVGLSIVIAGRIATDAGSSLAGIVGSALEIGGTLLTIIGAAVTVYGILGAMVHGFVQLASVVGVAASVFRRLFSRNPRRAPGE